MLAEGVQILISVTCVFHMKRYRETYGLVAAAWGKYTPAVLTLDKTESVCVCVCLYFIL